MKTMKLLCSTCLIDGRKLHDITNTEILNYYYRIIGITLTAKCIKICWECKALMKKIIQFEKIVKKANNILSKSMHLEPITRITNLLQSPTYTYSLPKSSKIYDGDNIYINKTENFWLDDSVKKEEMLHDTDLNLEYEDPIKFETAISERENAVSSEDEVLVKFKKHSNLEEEQDEKPRPKKKRKKKLKPEVRVIELSHEEMWREREADKLTEPFLNSEHKCHDCILGFPDEGMLKDHLDTLHEKMHGDEVCSICSVNFGSVGEMTAHFGKHFRRYECCICSAKTNDRKSMQAHLTTHSKRSLLKGRLNNFAPKENGTVRESCLECDKTFSHKAGLINHRNTVHKLENRFPCTRCDKVFRWRTSLKKHFDDVHEQKANERPYCTECDISFSSVCTYKRHLRTSLKHVTVNEFKFICDHCERKFSNKTKLRDHIEEKHLQRSFQCHLCSKPSKNRVCLDMHIRNVHRGRPNNKICNYCGKGFPTKIQLESHVRSHTGERPYICEYCPTTFSQQSNLYKHNRQVHLNIKEKKYSRKRSRRKNEDKLEMEERQNCFLSLHTFPV